MTFRLRLIAVVAALTLLTLGGAFAIVSMAVNRSQQTQLDEALFVVADREALEASALGGDELAIGDGPGPAANDVGPLPKHAVIYGPNGEIRATTANIARSIPDWHSLPRSPRPAFDLHVAGENQRAVMVDLPQRAGERLLVAVSRADLDGDAAFLARAMLLVFAVAVAWSVLVASWVVRQLTRDHEAIARVARRVAAGDLSARTTTRSSDREVVQLARDVDDMIARLEVLVTSQRRFIANAAHELRTPLTTLLGELSLARRKSRDVVAYEAAIDEALDGARRLKLLADDLLALARLGAEQETAITPVALDQVIAAAIETVSPSGVRRGVTLSSSGRCGETLGHGRDLERMLRNLLENAIRHAPAGTTICIEGATTDTSVHVTVSDRGEGVPAADRARIFEPFYRNVRAPEADDGAGLGLAIAREIARAHGGDLSLRESGDGDGATFVVALPLNLSRAETSSAVTARNITNS